MKPVFMNQSSFSRGQRLLLTLIKESEFPDGVTYYVLEDEKKRRFLLPALHYRQYGFVLNQEVKAVVDHINCNGRIFIEPDHPLFSPGKLARFTLIHLFNSPSGFYPAVVADGAGMEYPLVFGRGARPPGGEVLLTIRTVSKGRAYPEWPSAPAEPVRTPEFPVQCAYDSSFLLDNKELYHLLHYADVPALVKASWYPWFEPAPGSRVDCLLYGNKNGTWRAEPVNPVYPYGVRMYLTLVKAYPVDDLMRGLKKWADVTDEYGQSHTVMVGSVQRYTEGKQYPFRVSGYKRGRVVWEEE